MLRNVRISTAFVEAEDHPMSERHLIVTQRDSAWQYMYRGTVTGPFKSREQAIEGAISEARGTKDTDIEVVVQDLDLNQVTVWRSGEAG